MALIERTRLGERLYARYDDARWRLRYWWLDTESGAHAHVGAFVAALLVLVYQVFKMALVAVLPPAAGAPEHAIIWWVVQLIIAIISAILSYVLRPKTPQQPEAKQDGPTVEDGVAVDDHFGEVWITQPHLLAWRKVGTENIKSKGGKK